MLQGKSEAIFATIFELPSPPKHRISDDELRKKKARGFREGQTGTCTPCRTGKRSTPSGDLFPSHHGRADPRRFDPGPWSEWEHTGSSLMLRRKPPSGVA